MTKKNSDILDVNDIHLEWNSEKGYHDLEIVCDLTDLLGAINLRTAVMISLFTDRRTDDDDSTPNIAGWPGDDLRGVDEDLLGSKLHLLFNTKTLDENLTRAERFSLQALQWLLDDNIAIDVTVRATYQSKIQGIMKIEVFITEFTGESRRFEYVWKQKLVS